jgi:4-hydroxybenzoate polyprenyltransferase
LGSAADYFRERFPLPVVITLSVGTAIWLVASTTDEMPSQNNYVITALITVAFTAFLLRQRVMDEFKDRSHDDANYPNRPVQRGVITHRQLKPIGFIAFLIELSAVIAIAALSNHWFSLLTYLAVLSFSALTAYEFFAVEWLNRHFTIYFLSHQLIFVFFYIWALSIFGASYSLQVALNGFAFMLAMAALEIMRKFEIRRNSVGEIVKDTYLAVWGRLVSVTALALSFAIGGTLLGRFTFPLSLIGLLAGLLIVAVNKSNRAVQAATIVGFFAMGLVAYFS